MGILDRLFRRTPAETPPAPPGTATVPPGHRVHQISAATLPCCQRSLGGVWLAQLGPGTDEAADDLGRLLGELEGLRAGPLPRPRLAAAEGRLADLFAPASPAVVAPAGVLVWAAALDALAGAPDGARLVERLLRQIRAQRDGAEPPLQVLYLLDGDRPRACRVAEMVQGLGVEVRLPDPEGRVILLEVERPDGRLSALAGRSWRTPASSTPEELPFDADRLQPDPGDAPVLAVEQATRLRRLVLAVIDGSEGAAVALEEELRGRQVPLLVMIDAKTKGVPLRTWQSGRKALPVYPDHAAFRLSLLQMGVPSGAVMAAIMSPRELIPWAARQGWALALNAFRGDEALYLPLDGDVVRRLAGAVG